MNEDLWLKRLKDPEWFMDAFTEQSDKDLEKLAELVSDLKATEIGEMIIKRSQDYMGEIDE